MEFLNSVSHGMDRVVVEALGEVEHEEVAHPPIEEEVAVEEVGNANAAANLADVLDEPQPITCIVCFQEPGPEKNVIVPCGHAPLCNQCIQGLNQQAHAQGVDTRCPICRVTATSIIPLFLN